MHRPYPSLRLRTSVTILLVAVILVTLAIVGAGILAVMVPRVEAENKAVVHQAAGEIASRVTGFLANLEARVVLAGALSPGRSPAALTDLLDLARGPSLSAIYLVDAEGRLVAASIAGSSAVRTAELSGIDLSAYPLFQAAMRRQIPLWSDKNISAVTGSVTLGLAAPIPDGRGVVIAELPLEALLAITRIVGGTGSLDYWIVDSKGEVVVDTGAGAAERMNVAREPIVAAGFEKRPLPETLRHAGTTYLASAAYAPALGWLFVGRIPTGLANPELRKIVTIVLAVFGGSVLVGILLAPLWAQSVSRPIRAVAESASRIASGAPPQAWPRSSIKELNRLSADLEIMANATARREEELRNLNEELESRVGRRTAELLRSNRELSQALATVEQAKDELIDSEKLAALGRMVAGIAHELNTPLGNGRLAITSLSDRLARFENGLSEGLRRTELDAFVETVRSSSRIAGQNLARAAALVGSFKQVAADRTASRRRKFQLNEIVDEVLLTISPSMKHRPISLKIDVPAYLWLDSYPGDLGQALTNLIENCITHAFKGREQGSIAIEAEPAEPNHIVIRLRDDGIGMAPEVARRAFDPFFTTALGQGGTGLGLFITHNAVTNVLAGSIALTSRPGEGSLFELRLPRIAPLPEPPETAIAG